MNNEFGANKKKKLTSVTDWCKLNDSANCRYHKISDDVPLFGRNEWSRMDANAKNQSANRCTAETITT